MHVVLWIYFLRLVCPVLPVSLDCPFLIVPSVFSDVYLIKVHVIVMLVDGIDLILITVTREQTHRAAQRFPICRIGSSLAKEWGWQIMVRKVGPCIIVGYVSMKGRTVHHSWLLVNERSDRAS